MACNAHPNAIHNVLTWGATGAVAKQKRGKRERSTLIITSKGRKRPNTVTPDQALARRSRDSCTNRLLVPHKKGARTNDPTISMHHQLTQRFTTIGRCAHAAFYDQWSVWKKHTQTTLKERERDGKPWGDVLRLAPDGKSTKKLRWRVERQAWKPELRIPIGELQGI